jgi:hypothetical protein
MSAQPYFDHDEELSTTLYLIPKDRGRETVAAVTSSLHTALAGYAQAVEGAFGEDLARWAAEFEVVGDLLRAQQQARVDS